MIREIPIIDFLDFDSNNKKLRNSVAKKVKTIPKTSDVIFVVSVTFVMLFATNYFLDYVLYR